jgi:hypothetical protein
MPPLQQGNFGENDFYIFITSILDTLDLYHRQNINAGLAITILKGLTQDYPVQFEIVGLENRGSDQFLIKLKVFGKVSHFQLKQEYYAKYEQALPLYDPKKLIPNTDNIIAKIIEKVNNNPGTQIKSLYNEGIIITGGKVDIMEGNSYSITGDNNQAVQGDNNQVTQQSRVDTNTGEEITQAKVIELLAELSQKILSSELSEETKTKTLNRLSTVADDAKEPQPNKELVTGNLKKVTEILAEASKSTEEAKKLWNNVQPILKIIAKWLGVGIKVLTGM